MRLEIDFDDDARYDRREREPDRSVEREPSRKEPEPLVPPSPLDRRVGDPERRFATILEDDRDVMKWLKPPKDVLKIHYSDEDNYQPDFIVETKSGRFLCEIKRSSEVDDAIVQKKANAASVWCDRASTISDKPWKYSLLPDNRVQINRTFLSLVS